MASAGQMDQRPLGRRRHGPLSAILERPGRVRSCRAMTNYDAGANCEEERRRSG
jgi:hypothetical protein